ncbi:hypothetical protein [Fusobacterium varium]|uniref:hypothetical protein n=1 Tax=Fusobacterium varium TaxID=856 RepID=UPI002FE48158
MLSDDAKLVMDFIEECRNQLALKDDFHFKNEEMHKVLWKVREFLGRFTDGDELYLELEDIVISTVNLAKDTYFEYGDNFAQVRSNRFFRRVNEEVS